MLGLSAGGVVCARAGSVIDKEDDGVYILGAAGEFATYINESLNAIHDDKIIKYVTQCLKDKRHIYQDDFSVLYMNRAGYEAAVFLNISEEISQINRQLLEVFLSSVSVGYENVNLFHQLRNAAFRDWLTKLPNRNEFINMLDDAKHENGAGSGNVVALIDINHFSDVNDGLGQDAGNNLLIAVADRLQDEFGESVKLGRIGADVFGIIGAESLVNPAKIGELFITPFKAGDHTLPLNISIGLCRMGSDNCTGITILKQTNIALNRAKKDSRPISAITNRKWKKKTTWRLGMIRQLRTDFSDRRLQVWYQPQVDLVSEKIVGMEALLRWPSKDGGFISPVVFVPFGRIFRSDHKDW